MKIFTGIAAVLILFALSVQGSQLPEKASPFTAVKWEGDTPVVRFENEWYYLKKIERFNMERIIDFAKQEYGDRWQKRFSEDLVEVLKGMGYTPNVRINLILQKEGKIYEKQGIMSEENRDRVREYNNTHTARESKPEGTIETTPVLPKETASQQRMAELMAKMIDTKWEATPAEDSANLRFLMKKDGRPFAGKTSIYGEFSFRALQHGSTHHQAFNPNKNGRWVYEDLEPGTYDLVIEGSGQFAGWEWRKNSVSISAGEAPLFEIDLAK